MKRILFIFIFIIAVVFSVELITRIAVRKVTSYRNTSKLNYEEVKMTHYLDEIKKGSKVLNHFRREIHEVLDTTPCKREVLSIVFPETMRYNTFKDILESSANNISYLHFGSTHTDFSVGIFQMKLSFVEELERYILQAPSLTFLHFILPKNKSKTQARKERLERVKSTYWQIIYAYCFYQVARHKFKSIEFKNKNDRLSFYAAAYNYGFLNPVNEIYEWRNQQMFPYGKNYKEKQYAFSDFTLTYYQNFSMEY